MVESGTRSGSELILKGHNQQRLSVQHDIISRGPGYSFGVSWPSNSILSRYGE